MQMLHSGRMVFATLLILGPGCRAVPPQPPSPTASAPRAIIKFQSPHYDGSTFSGRILVGAEEGAITVDRRLVENQVLQVTEVHDCDSPSPVSIEIFGVPPRRVPEELMTLEPGTWLEADVAFPLFNYRRRGAQEADCLDLTVTLNPRHPTPPATTTLRVSRPMEQPDAE
ncbi:hypothetical protein COCOR_03950 [Corallococcus coralloides DSM 2259]|uniref:Uncharacterized protein n=1 Tax=Corallococcus coralloides (strain ATCC 25202 / DSM 2259 / NBRC 100086 / M2) TaxID=1144275 RepID=H8MU39_CORCM|nr:hypothetical protein [Corallococcus coralloides]AFE05527.1 hypothetical protein COCOR_03950 [Corallococcus coralloides DSM 2259]